MKDTASRDLKDAKDQVKSDAKDLLKQQLKSLVRARMGVTDDWFPLSYGQDALWFLWKLAPDSPAFSMVLPVGIRGPLDAEALRRALRTIVERHPSLAMAFREEADGSVRQRPMPDPDPGLRVTDAADWDEASLREAVTREARRPFDLASDARLRALLLRRGPEDHVLVLTLHHIAGDLWSLIVLMDELRTVYAAVRSDRPDGLPALGIGYQDFVRSERRAVAEDTSGAVTRALEHWKRVLGTNIPVLDLPLDRSRPPRQSFRGATITRRLGPETATAIDAFAEEEGATPFMVLLAAYCVLLHRYTGQDRVIVGTPFLGRAQPGLADLIGDFINMLPMVGDCDPDATFRDLVRATRTAVLEAMRHQACPFSVLVDAVQPARDVSRSPIFQTTFVLQKFHRYPELQAALLPSEADPTVPFADLELIPMPLAQQDGQFDLNLEMKRDAGGGLVGAWKFAADLFDAETVEAMAGRFETLLVAMLNAPASPVGEMPLLRGSEAARMVAGAQGPSRPVPEARTLAGLFARQRDTRPDAIAVCHGETSLSYAELGDRADALARALVAAGLGREEMVALMLPRSPELVAAMLGVSRAGGAFLPLGPDLPSRRLAQVLENSGARFVMTSRDAEPGLSRTLADTGTTALAVETLIESGAYSDLPAEPDGDALAYMMYTSGSTGTPKGVMVEHKGMVNHILGKLEDLEFGPEDVLAQNAPHSFDVVVWQALAPLAVGGRVEILPDRDAEDPDALLAATVTRGITMLQVVPSMMRAMIETIERKGAARRMSLPLRWLVPTGEALPTELCRRWFTLYPDIPILNTYGSTECSDDQCHYPFRALAEGDRARAVITVGRPIRNMAAYVLDSALAPVPPGVVGEIYIGGIGVGRGYRGNPEKTAEAFLDDPFAPGARLYKTRDLARQRADGLIDFLGRIDGMIKLNGVRIEPGEIETVLVAHDTVRSAIVEARPGPGGDDLRLVAYLVPAGDALDPAALRRYLAERLPFSMIPSEIVTIDRLPLTPNGKLDRDALPAPAWQGAAPDTYEPPQAGTEETIAGIWRALLSRDRIGRGEDFFASGGDSIRSIQVAARCRQAGLPVEPLDLFLARTVQALAETVAVRLAEGVEVVATQSADALSGAPLVSDDLLARAAKLVRFDDD